MSQGPDLTRVLDDMAGRARAERMPDPVSLRRAADGRHRRRLAMAAACVAALVVVPLTVTMARQDQAVPVSPSGFDCLAPAHGPRPSHWEGGTRRAAPTDSGWVETFPTVPPGAKVEFASVVANATGYLVTGRTYAGTLGRTFHDNQWMVWSSADGRSWTPFQRPNRGGNDLLATDDGFYAAGFAKDGSPALWSTTNGRNWRSTTIVHIPQRLDVDDSKLVIDLHNVACVDGQLVAYGLYHGTKAGWGSSDGRHWNRLDPNGPFLHDLSSLAGSSLAGDGPAGTVAISPWGDGFVPERIWLQHS